MQKGHISINTENILPIIKKWLYSDKDIFIRELIANGCDAITKHRKLVAMGEAAPDAQGYKITVRIDKEQKTLTFSDNGLGMTQEEVEKYINQVAFSGAQDFLDKYKEGGDAIIGHFGLGFYSAFMVSKTVSIETLSHEKGALALRWTSDGGTEYEIDASEKAERGSDIVLLLNDDDAEFLSMAKVREVIEKYCAFLPVPIYLEDISAKQTDDEPDQEHDHNHVHNHETDETDEECTCDHEHDEECTCDHEHDEECTCEKKKDEPKPLNDTSPLWLKAPKDCTDEEYKEFYRKVFKTWEEPLFWIHLNVDYPFNLKGILYFPQLRKEFDGQDGQIKLYNNQVFVADNIKEVIPEFLMLLKGVIDCPDLPLNVSRSFLQNDGTVKKLQTHITKKVADKLSYLFTSERENYDKYWKDINPFVKYGAIKDDKFFEMIKEILLFERLNGSLWTLQELRDYAKENGGKVYYVSDAKAQAFYIDLFKKHDQEAVLLTGVIDNHLVMYLEYKCEGLTFGRIDSDIAQSIKGEYIEMPNSAALESLLRKATGNEKLTVEVAPLKASELPSMLIMSEEMRRFAEMTSRFGSGTMSMPESKLILNAASPIIKKLASMEGDTAELIAAYVYDIALLGRGLLTAEETKGFIERSSKVLSLLAAL